jgi:asparagine synthase (glutamine-hydrolysing)
MCRIAGIIDNQNNSEQFVIQIKAMCAIMAHGGPDDEGSLIIDNSVAFGHRRLSILDLSSAGHQPMIYEDLTITYNGEIYNYQSLKNELKILGFSFKTETDTEVILVGFKVWGTALFNKLEGMFAFALYQQTEKTTYLVRDQMGIKPLYYSTKGNCLIFSSEVKAFEQSAYQFTENKDWPIYFLAFGHIPQPYTTLTEVLALTGGSYLKWNNIEATYQIIPYHQPLNTKTIKCASKAVTSIAEELKNAVNHQLVADATIGVFLSGGIDSSIITLLANEAKGKELNTISINFNEAQFSEESYQNIINAKTEGKHSSYRVTAQDFNASFNQIMTAMDQPTNDGINSWFVNKCAKENGLKAVLSGIGADELLGGYPSFKRMKLIKNLKKLPKIALRLCENLPSEKLKRIYYLSYKNPIGEYLFLRGFFTPNAISKIIGKPIKDVNHLFENFPLDKSINNLNGEERAAWFESNLFMKNQLLKDTDFMSMSHGVEVRVPFLDQQFITTVAAISNEYRFLNRPKGLLINAFKNILPKAIWDRPKMGFTFPLHTWFLNHDLINDDANYSNLYVKKLIGKFKAGKMHWSKAFALYQINNYQKHK